MKITITSPIFIEGKYFGLGAQAEVPFRVGQNLIGMDVAKEFVEPVQPVPPVPPVDDPLVPDNEGDGVKEPESQPSSPAPAPVKPKSKIP